MSLAELWSVAASSGELLSVRMLLSVETSGSPDTSPDFLPTYVCDVKKY
jgi:hypothetical protein